MNTTNKLKWEAEVADSGKGWVTVTPSTGMGDTNVSINVTNSDVWADPSTLESTVTFRCTNCELLDESEKIKTIRVCRCACDCDKLEVYSSVTETITENGLPAGETIGTYNLLTRCSQEAVTATIKSSKTGTEAGLKCENGAIKLVDAIGHNQSMDDVTYTVNIYFDRGHLPTPCSTFSFTQSALDCTCNSAVRGKITYSNYFNGTTKIPQAGLPVGTELFTYSLKEYCPDSSQYFTAKVTYASTTRDVTISGGRATLAQAIGSNGNTGERTATLKVYYKGTECESRDSRQIGCSCAEYFVEESFEVTIPTFRYENEGLAVKVGDSIGSYTKKQGSTCPDTAITASLTSNGVTYPLTCSNGVVKLGGNKNIPENITHDNIPFTATVSYDGSVCDTDVINQKGVACNCDDITGKVSQFVTIPKTGATAGFVLGSYSLAGTQCSDANDCMKIEEVNNLVGAKFDNTNKKIVTTTNIGNNEDPSLIYYKFRISYKVNNKWRECDFVETTQEGLGCSCKMVTIEGGGEWALFPISGTRGLVTFGRADTGLYKYKGTPQEEIVGVCGSLSADCNCSTIIPHDGFNVTTIAIPLTPEEIEKGLDMPHIYEFQVDLGPTATTAPITQRADLYFIPKDGSQVETCDTDVFGFKYDPNACNCQMSNMSSSQISCDGYTELTTIGSVSANHTGMTMTAELLKDGQEYDICPDSITGATYEGTTITLIGYGGYAVTTIDASSYLEEGETINSVRVSDGQLVIRIRTSGYTYRTVNVDISTLVDGKKYTKQGTTFITDFQFSMSSSSLIVKGKVAANATADARDVGIVRVYYWCNKGKVNEWYCGCKDFSIRQGNGCVCDCNYVANQQESSYYLYLNFSHDSTTAEVLINGLNGFKDCAYYYIEGVSEDGYLYLPSESSSWCKVKVEKTGNYGWYLYGEITDGQHDNRETSVTVKYAYLSGYDEQQQPIYVDCGYIEIPITDEVCDCTSIENLGTAKTVTISEGYTTGSTWLGYQKIKDCVNLYILGADGTKYYAKPYSPYNVYTFKDPDTQQELFDAWLINGYTDKDTKIEVKLKEGVSLTKSYHLTIKGDYINSNGDRIDCDKVIDVEVKQKSCDCSTFKGKVTLYDSFSYSQSSTSEETELEVAYVYTGCGKGTLFVEYGGNKYCANDLNGGSWPSELNYIVGMTEACATGYLKLVVKTLTQQESYRHTKIGVCWCDEDEGQGSCKCTTENCEKTTTIEEKWSINCYDVSCSDFNYFSVIKEATGEFEVPCGGVSGALVAKYPTPPDCFTVELVCSHNAVHPYKQTIDSDYVGIYINADAVDKKESPTVDVHVYKDGDICESLSQDFIKITLCGN